MGRAFEYRRAAKEKRWASMSKIFPKLAKLIQVAAKEGGPDPEMNPALRTAIQNAKAQNMPKSNIEAAIKRSQGKDAEDYKLINYEGKGPHGILVYVECATNNSTRTVANVKAIFSKAGGSVVPNGSIEYLFDRKGVFELEVDDTFDIEEFELNMIDVGLTDIERDESSIYAYCDYLDFGIFNSELEKTHYKVLSAKLERIPNAPIEFNDQQMKDIQPVLDKLEEDDDIQAIYTNMA